MSSSESNLYIVIPLGCDIQGIKRTGSTCFDVWISDQSGIGAGMGDGMHSCVCGFHDPCLIWLLPGREVTCRICNFLGTLSKVSIGWPNAFGGDDTASSDVWRWTTTGTFNWSSRISYPSHGSCRPLHSSLVVSSWQGSSASAENTSCDISNDSSLSLKHPGVPDCFDCSDATSYPLTENYTLPVPQATGGIPYIPPLLCGDVYAWSEWHVCYTSRRGCSYAEAVYTTPGDVYACLRPSSTFYLSSFCYILDAAISPYMFRFDMMSLITMQSSLRIHRKVLHLLPHYRILQVWNILSNLQTL